MEYAERAQTSAKVASSRKEALERGLKRYYNGNPCPKGHIAARATKSSSCVVCVMQNREVWRKKNPERFAGYTIKWKNQNPDSYKESRKKSNAKYLRKVENRISASMSSGIWASLKYGKEGQSWETIAIKYLGYDLNMLIAHLASQFTEGMTLENYGSFWHIDHIIPKVEFHYDSYEDEGFKKCWGLPNLRPLKGKENIEKKDKVLPEHYGMYMDNFGFKLV